jgi:protoporphyrinogen oxidase
MKLGYKLHVSPKQRADAEFRRALEDTLRDIAIHHARKQVTHWESWVEDTLRTIERAERAQPQYKEAFASDLRRARRELPKQKKELALWKRRLKVLKGTQ